MRFWHGVYFSSGLVVLVSLVAGGCKSLGEKPAPLSAATIKGFHDATGGGDVATMKKMLDMHPGLLDARDEGRATPLITAAYAQKADVVKMLLERGADVNAQKKDGWSALHFAAWRGEEDIAKMLLDHGAKVDVKKPDGGTPLHAAVADGHLEVAKLLVAAGADVNAKKKDGWTPLRFAAERKNKDVAAFLRSKGAKE